MTSTDDRAPTTPESAGFPDDFRDFIRALNACDVQYLLVGGYAVGVYGHVRATADIDFLYRCTSQNVERVVRALTLFGAPTTLIDPQHLLSRDAVTQFGTPPLRIDLLANISGVTFEEARVGAVRVAVAGDLLPVIGLEALRANKLATGRSKDLDDVKHLLSSRDTRSS